MEELQIRPGDVIASKYRVEKVLGAGGMGVVVAARHVALGSLVAIKVMQPRAVSLKGAVERFMREGQAAAALSSKHVAKVIDVGQLDTGTPYMIMEHLSGSDLSSIVEKKGAIPLADAAEYLLQACDGIGEAHAKGIVHRDLKPANLFLLKEPDGSPLIKVLDFGIAKVSGSEQGLTGTSQGMGSGGYMSPEQMSSAKKVDHRADIWALGVTFYELVTAHRPFEAESLEQFVTAVIWGQPTPLATYRPDLPPDVEAIVMRCLEKQPDNRFSTVAHFAQRLAAYAPARAHVYVGRVAGMLGVGAPSLTQTNPGMPAPSAPTGGVPTAFGPAPQVAVAAAPSPAQSPSGPAPVTASSTGPHPQAVTPPPAFPQTANLPGPHPLAASQSGPHPLAASQSGPHPLAASQSGPHAQAVSLPGMGITQDGRTSNVPVATTGPVITAGPAAITPQKPPIALFFAAAVGLLVLGGGAVYFVTRPSTPASADALPPVTTSTTTPPAVTVTPGTADKPAADSAPSGSGSAGAPAAPGVSGEPSPSGKPVAGTKSTTSAKAGTSAGTTASSSASTSTTSTKIGGGRL